MKKEKTEIEEFATGMKIERIALTKIKPSPYNPRRIGDRMRAELEKSLDAYGLVDPLIVNRRTMHVVGGNQRLAVLKVRKVKDVSVHFVDVDDDRERALNVALNKIAADWDSKALKTLLSEVGEGAVTGFDTDEISFYLEQGQADFDGAAGKGAPEGDAPPEERTTSAPEKPANEFPYMVYFTFKTQEAAQAFVEEQGFPTRVEEGQYTTRVRVTYDRKGKEKHEA